MQSENFGKRIAGNPSSGMPERRLFLRGRNQNVIEQIACECVALRRSTPLRQLKADTLIHPWRGEKAHVGGDTDFLWAAQADAPYGFKQLARAIAAALAGGRNAIVAELHVRGQRAWIPRHEADGCAI